VRWPTWEGQGLSPHSAFVDEADGLLEAAPHAVERLAELRHLVLALVRELGALQAALRDAVGASDSCVIGCTIIAVSMMLRITNSTANTTVSELMKVTKALFALRIGRSIGTDTICAPITSLCFQPKPLAAP
jgi:hypothetical protein